MTAEVPEDSATMMAAAYEAVRSGEFDVAFDLVESALVEAYGGPDGPDHDHGSDRDGGPDHDGKPDGTDTTTAVDAFAQFALVVFAAGNNEASLRAAKRLRELQEQVLGREHPDVFATRTVIVTLTAQLFEFDDALALAVRLLGDQQRVLGNDHPDVLRTRSTLAFLNAQKGELDLAIELFANLLEDQRRILGPDDGAVRLTHHELAFARIQRALLAAPETGDSTSKGDEDGAGVTDGADGAGGVAGDESRSPASQAELPQLDEDPEVALDQLVDELVLRAAIEGRRHPLVLSLRSLLSQCFDAVGDHLHAYVMAVGLLDDQREIQGADHPGLFQLRFVVADLMSRVGDQSGALDQLRTLLADQQRVFDEGHPMVVATRHRVIALSVATVGRPEEGASTPESTPSSATEASDHLPTDLESDPFEGRLHAAVELAGKGNTIEAVAKALALLDSQLGVLGADHPDARATSAMLSTWVGTAGGFDALPAALSRLLASQPEGVEALDTRRALNVLTPTDTASLAGLFDDTVLLVRADHPDLMVLRDQLVDRVGSVDENGESRGTGPERSSARLVSEALVKLMARQDGELGAAHPETLRTRNLIADMTARNGEVEKALDLFVEILADQRRAFGMDHRDTLVTRWNIASWMGETGDLGNAIPLMQSLADDQMASFGPADPALLETRHTVAAWLARSGQIELAIERFEELLETQRGALGERHPDAERTRTILASLRNAEA